MNDQRTSTFESNARHHVRANNNEIRRGASIEAALCFKGSVAPGAHDSVYELYANVHNRPAARKKANKQKDANSRADERVVAAHV